MYTPLNAGVGFAAVELHICVFLVAILPGQVVQMTCNARRRVQRAAVFGIEVRFEGKNDSLIRVQLDLRDALHLVVWIVIPGIEESGDVCVAERFLEITHQHPTVRLPLSSGE